MKQQLTMEQLLELVNSAVSKQVEALGVTRADRRHAIFPTEDLMMGRKQFTPETYTACASFLRGLILPEARYNEMRGPGGQTFGAFWKDLSVGSAESGGYLVPAEFHTEVLRDLAKRPILRNIVRVMPITASDQIPTVTGKPTLSWPGENTSPGGTGATFGQLALSAKLALGYVPVSRRLASNPKVDIVQLLVTLFGEVIGNGEDEVLVGGSGTGQPKGFRHTDFHVTAAAQAGATLAADDLIDLYHSLPLQYRATATWLMPDSVVKKIRKLKDKNEQYIWAAGLNGAPETILGRPVFPCDEIPANLGSDSPATESEIWFGDWKVGYILGDAETMSVETTAEGAGAFERHQIIVKVWEEIDGSVAVANALRKMTGVK